MHSKCLGFIALLACLPVTAQAGVRYSTGGVAIYTPCGLGPDLPLSPPEAADFRSWYDLASHVNVTRWENGDVWGSDFRDGTDLAPDGGSDAPQVYFFAGHGTCTATPSATDVDNIVTCGNAGTPNFTNIGASSRWGNNGGTLQFMFVDASCPMKLSSMANQWFAPFQGLHMATGHSGDIAHDTLDSRTRGSQFAGYTVGATIRTIFGEVTLFPQEPVLAAWVDTGLIDVQSQVCAVTVAGGVDSNDALHRLDQEFVTSGWANPTPTNAFMFAWVCKP